MAAENKTHSGSSETRVPLSLIAVIVVAGVANEVIAAVSENRNPSGSLPTVLMFVEGVICLFVIAATVEIGRDRSARKLLLTGIEVTAAALISVAIGAGFKLGGDTSAAFGSLYFVWVCAICGLSLLIVAVVRFVAERRKQRSSAIE